MKTSAGCSGSQILRGAKAKAVITAIDNLTACEKPSFEFILDNQQKISPIGYRENYKSRKSYIRHELVLIIYLCVRYAPGPPP